MVRNQSALVDPIECVICRRIIVNPSHIHQSKETYAVYCNRCREQFSEEDIAIMANLFFTHGGYFGQVKSDISDLEDLLKELFKDARLKHRRMSLEDFNIRLFHKVLTHGIPPHKFLEMLKT